MRDEKNEVGWTGMRGDCLGSGRALLVEWEGVARGEGMGSKVSGKRLPGMWRGVAGRGDEG